MREWREQKLVIQRTRGDSEEHMVVHSGAVPMLFFPCSLPSVFWRNEGTGEEGHEDSFLELNKTFDLEQNICIYRTET